MRYLFLSKVAINAPPPGSPTGPLQTELPVYRGFLHISQIPYRIPLNKEIYPFSQRSQERSVPQCSPKAWPLWKQTPISRALLSISFGVTSNGARPPGSPHRTPPERDAPFLVPSCLQEYRIRSNFVLCICSCGDALEQSGLREVLMAVSISVFVCDAVWIII